MPSRGQHHHQGRRAQPPPEAAAPAADKGECAAAPQSATLAAAALALLVSLGLLLSFFSLPPPPPPAAAASALVAVAPLAAAPPPPPLTFPPSARDGGAAAAAAPPSPHPLPAAPPPPRQPPLPHLAPDLHQRAQARLAEWTAAAGLSAALVARGLALVGSPLPFQRLARRQAAARAGGQPPANITVLVLGGSTAAGAELEDPALHFAARFAAWLSSVFYDAHVTVLNAAIGATGSDYMALCGGEHMGRRSSSSGSGGGGGGGGGSSSDGVDIVLADHALNDVGWALGDPLDYGPNLYGAEHAASALEQALGQVAAAAPGAAYAYAGVYPGQQRWRSGEDLPGFTAVLQHWRVGYVSTRNLVLGPPASWPAPAPDAPPQPNMDAPLVPPFAWGTMFPGGSYHPRGEADNYLGLLLAAWVTEALGAVPSPPLAEAGAAGAEVEPPPPHLHNASHPAPCLAGLPFTCRTTLSPSFGVPLMPLPTACVVDWSGGLPELQQPGCALLQRAGSGNSSASASASAAWEAVHFDSPALPLVAGEVPLVDGWEWLEMGAVHGGPMGKDESGGVAGRAGFGMRQDRKLYWGATRENVEARFPVQVGPRGALAVVYITAQNFGEAVLSLHCAGMEPGGEVPTGRVSGAHQMRVTKTHVLVRGGLAPGKRCILKVHAVGLFGMVGVAS
jgi:hypothetical protein